MVQPMASDALTAFQIASLLTTGSVPGWPMQTSHTVVLASLPKASLLQPQNIFVFVFIWAWTSRPMMASNWDMDRAEYVYELRMGKHAGKVD